MIGALMCAQPDTSLKELLPGVHIGEGVVEFDGTVAIDCHHRDTPDVFLEMLVTSPDSREHESLVVSSITPSILHAGLLAAGAASGSPLRNDDSGDQIPATGDRIKVFVAMIEDGTPGEFVAIESWVIDIERSQFLGDDPAWKGLVFAGSIIDSKGYQADRAGTLVSLTSFGNEVVAPAWSVSHLAEIDEPMWIANSDLVPERNTPIRIRLEVITVSDSELHEPDRIDIDRDM